MAIPCIFVNGVITMVLDNKQVRVDESHPMWEQIKGAIATATPEEMLNLFNYREDYIGEMDVEAALLEHPTIQARIDEHIEAGIDPEYLLRFLENVSLNPSYSSRLELYDFLEHQSLPLTPDGCFLAYKSVKNNYMDKHTGTISNHVGAKVKMDRSKVDDNRNAGCSKGLHAGSLSYAKGYQNWDDNLVLVKINPKDAVSVPLDCSCQKIRLCYYEVVSDFKEELNYAVYDEVAEEPIEGAGGIIPTLTGEDVDTLPELDMYDDCWDDGDVENVYEDGENAIDPSRPMDQSGPTVHNVIHGKSVIDSHKAFVKALNDVEEEYGFKPDGRKYHNKRGPNGCFAPRK